MQLGSRETRNYGVVFLALLLTATPSGGESRDEREASGVAAMGERHSTVSPANNILAPLPPITMADALARTLSGSPELDEFSYEQRIAAAELIQAKVRPNPAVEIAVENLPASGYFSERTQFQNTIQLSQLVELGEKRQLRADVAQRQQEELNNRYELEKLRVLSEVARRYLHVLSDQLRMVVIEKHVALTSTTQSIIRNRLHAGRAPELELVKAEIARERIDIAYEHAQHELLASRYRLASMWGGKPDFGKVVGNLFDLIQPPEYAELLSYLDNNPEWRAKLTATQVSEAELSLARAKAVPDITLGAGLRHGRSTEDISSVFGVSLPLPIFDRNEGGRLQAESRLQQSRVAKRTLQVRQETLLFELYQELRHAFTEARALARTMLPKAQRAIKLAEDGFRNGHFSHVELLEVQQAEIELEHEHIAVGSRYQDLRLQLEELLAKPLADINKETRKVSTRLR